MEAPRIAIVDDDAEMAKRIAQALEESGFRCVRGSNGRDGLALAKEVDLMVADIMMPVMTGYAMVDEMRQQGLRTPVIFLSAKDQTKDVVEGLEVGGDDYLIKPFKLEELIARIRAALRRARDTSRDLIWQDIRLDKDTRGAKRAGQELYLSATEFLLLEQFLTRPGEILSKKLLLQRVWADDGYRDENIVELYVNYLRKKTEVHGLHRVIQTVRGRGYVLADADPEP